MYINIKFIIGEKYMGIINKITEKVAVLQENLITGSDIFAVLKRDHRKVTELFARIQDTSDNELTLRKQLFNELKVELQIHSLIEENLFYSHLRNYYKTKNIITDSYQEHAEIRSYLEKLSYLNIDTHEWMNNLKVLKSIIVHHVQEEEGDLFPLSKEVFSDEELEQIGQSFMIEKQNAKSVIH